MVVCVCVGGDVVRAEMDVARVIYPAVTVACQARGGWDAPLGGRHQPPVGGSESALYPVNDVHQAQSE